MARLKTKQISDFTTAVQTLIDNDSDQNAGLIDALEASVDSLEAVAGGTVTADLTASVDSLETYADGISSDLAAEISATNGDVTNLGLSVDSLETQVAGVASDLSDYEGDADASIDSLEIYADGISSDLANEATARGNADTIHNASIDSLEVQVGAVEQGDSYRNASIDSLEILAGANETAISNMLSGSSLDLDTFAEIVSFVESVDTVNDGLVSSLTANTGASIDSLEVQVTGLTGGSGASIDSLEIYVDGISSDLAAEITATNGDVTAINASVDSLETALSSEISTTDGEITAINASINSLELYDLVFEQGGNVASTTEFTLATPVKFGANDNLLVFINGHNIHKNGSIEGAVEGYETADGATFTLVSIGYDIDVADHVTVVGIAQ